LTIFTSTRTRASDPDDYGLATGETHSVREFVELAFKEVGRDIVWEGAGLKLPR
jgi:GDPmannose 4,6-dehydratase